MAISRRCLLTLLWLGAAACDAGLGGVGQACSTSEECLPGLLCDFGRAPHSCQSMDSLSHDLAARIGDAGVPDLTSLGDP